MIVVVALGALLVAVVVFAFIRVRSLDQRAAALVAERARLAADGEPLTYEEDNLPASGDATELAEADLAALKWADRAGWWVD